ncbi:hypothetical protein Pse7367_3840 (plasmid) [Thalassoporum mexicanum PCC 7367]|uniref:hypothetical protein n=1 Tax=Thalassoporum mexicanum TaxID=3457544 RepID=UPI00029FBA39|nr:hypothetical protein [Pseudanabaena sp. PCC 7367]AFY72063.1 hypothetical protein Pse7367_3840 [Pseudanabaena sp. PCC 7367]
MNKTIDRFLFGFRQRLEHSSSSPVDSTDTQTINPYPTYPVCDIACDLNRYCSVDRAGEVSYPLKQHSSHELLLDEAKDGGYWRQGNRSPVSLSTRAANRIWQFSYELIQVIYSKNITEADRSQE